MREPVVPPVKNGLAFSELESLCQALQAEPLLHASLGSKELFHSNLLGWAAERFPEQSRRLWDQWLVPGSATVTRVRREFQHLDLVIEFAGFEPLVIENKTFSLPDEEQLARYTEHAVIKVNGAPTLVLLGVTDPGWPGGAHTVSGQTWRYVSYGALAGRLAAEFAHAESFDGEVLTHEARLMQLLHQVTGHAGVRNLDEPFQLTAEVARTLADARILDAVGKMRGHQVMQLIRERIVALDLRPSRTEVGFTNGQPLLAAFWLGPDGNGVGWQYQGGQWRLAMILHTLAGRAAAKVQQRASFATQHLGWFDFTVMCDVLGCTDSSVRPQRARIPVDGFNKYDPDFVYRYRVLPPVTVRQFTDLALAYSKAAAAWQWS